MTNTTVYRMGSIYKQGRKRGWFGRDNWKARYAILTGDCLLYYKTRGGSLKGSVDLTRCTLQDIEIMPPDCLMRDQDTKNTTIWRIAIKTPQRRFVLAAFSQQDMDAWVEALEHVVLQHGRPSSGSSVDTRLSSMERYTEMKATNSFPGPPARTLTKMASFRLRRSKASRIA
ncbi:hypothetical protein H310_12480 [Aphanomyces invadans]|uniref:PH domain-containing protein n=1 Tax=Aphanomyces invadans TaxID=157072 RepID=A0A024TJC1_9STRA|nr:hypothetical protein H310_12480 [Aphanomyces invadans]ETV93716.1 hypothetical protein H310_12480 [Aphanomyces invadans]|eukprot:XP_008877757.1 hypothetical protein H310_12480 [Aphanomyces invadans]